MMKDNHMSNITEIEKKKCEDFLKKCMRYLRKKEFELNLPTNATKIAIKCFNIRKTNHRHCTGRAGRNVITVNFNYWQKDKAIFTEYSSYSDSPVIGSIEVKDDFDYMRIQIAHELAHHIQFRYGPYNRQFRRNYRKPHGDCFKTIYKYLRKEFIN